MLKDDGAPKFPPSRREDQHIGFVLRAEPPNELLGRLSTSLESELESQLADLLQASFTCPLFDNLQHPFLVVMKDQLDWLCVHYKKFDKV